MIYAIINSENIVVNVVVINKEKDWYPPENHRAVPLTKGGIGWTFEDGDFIPPPTVASEPLPES